MRTLILAEHDNQTLNPSTFAVCKAASEIGGESVVLVAGYNCSAVAKQAATLAGIHTVICVDDKALEHPLAEQYAKAVLHMADDYDAILAPATTFGKNVLPRVAGVLDLMQVSDVTRIIDASTFEHPIYAGNAIETVHVRESKKILTIRPTAFEGIKASQPLCCIEQVSFTFNDSASQWVSQSLSVSSRPELANAKRVVSGGRGLQSAEKFKLIEELADALGAAVGASRAAVDAGFVPNDYQVGQTGKVVAPELYIAVGISGAVQHLAGMKDSKVIVAINKDEDAPLFQIADYGLVGDLFDVVPELITKLTT